jgi:hypothetical protein
MNISAHRRFTMKEKIIRMVLLKLGLSRSFYDDFFGVVFVSSRLLQIPTGDGTRLGRLDSPLAI